MEELRQCCAAKMKQASQKAQRSQQVLELQVRLKCFKCLWVDLFKAVKYASIMTDCVCCQVFQLQQEKKKLQEDFSSLLQNKEMLEKRCATIQREQTQLGPRLEETKWEVSDTCH